MTADDPPLRSIDADGLRRADHEPGQGPRALMRRGPPDTAHREPPEIFSREPSRGQKELLA